MACEGHVPGRQPRHLLRDEEARRRVRHELRHAGQERSRHRRRACARSRSASAPACPSPTAPTCWASCRSSSRASFSSAREVQKPIEIIRAATLIGAEIVRQVGQARLPEARRLRRSAGHRRQSAREPRRPAGAGQVSRRDHEGRRASTRPSCIESSPPARRVRDRRTSPSPQRRQGLRCIERGGLTPVRGGSWG